MIVTLFLWGLAFALGGWLVYARGLPALLGTRKAANRFVLVLPRMVAAILTAGFIGKLVPSGPVAAHIGPDSGVGGVLLATLVGGFIPAGPIISFPLVVVLHEAGAGLTQLIALLTAWSVFAFHRIAIYETPLMGWRFTALRLTASLPLPFVAAAIAAAILGILP